MGKIVVLDGYTENPGDLSWHALGQLGELTVYERTTEHLLIERMQGADYVYTNKVCISRAALEACPTIKFIGVLATGFNMVDLAAAKEKGITVTNIPTYGTNSVAQFVFALLLEICHHVAHHSQAVRAGRWMQSQDWCFWDYPLIELADKTLGLWGFGRIGQATAKIAESFGMHVLAYDGNPQAMDKRLARQVNLDELLAKSDVLSLHMPLTPETDGILNAETIARMKNDVIIINTARGGLINERDMRAALDGGKVAWYAADTTRVEPILADNPLLGAEHCIITPHIAWAPKESRQRLMSTAVDNLRQFLAGKPINVVNS
ncbi:MAG: D-2-hydroxyacid dehydrogenase [Anaerolineaceae bacterium]|nr:D-2-hydroxyacid dehydrogenase [Anaerolineaceae bacterium]